MTEDSRQPVISGKPYRVISGATSLQDFLGEAELTVESGGAPHVIRGLGFPHDAGVRFHEKDGPGGKDVRVWRVTQSDFGFVAEHIAAF